MSAGTVSNCVMTKCNRVGGTATDLDGQPRVRQGAVDMGAYEALPPAGTVMVIR